MKLVCCAHQVGQHICARGLTTSAGTKSQEDFRSEKLASCSGQTPGRGDDADSPIHYFRLGESLTQSWSGISVSMLRQTLSRSLCCCANRADRGESNQFEEVVVFGGKSSNTDLWNGYSVSIRVCAVLISSRRSTQQTCSLLSSSIDSESEWCTIIFRASVGESSRGD